ncbi:DUF397 domain-containing protein [Streptomyces sp. ODS28]|uniref:DUF397 domain-containing protein n=1 Tax=Streptomyces sp. ODS28 TaxID=3136688 RepID=UPI0031E952B7
MPTPLERDLNGARWRKSSHSNGLGGDCLEVADGHGDLVPVRDSKDTHRGTLTFSAPSWRAFIDSLRG